MKTPPALTGGCRLNSRQAKSATSLSLRTMRRRSESSNGAGRFRCLTEWLRDCGTSSCITAACSLLNG